MSESIRRMYVESVSSATVTLRGFTQTATGESKNDYGGGLGTIVVTTTEATAAPTFWGTTGTCAIFDVIIRKVS